MMVAMDPTTRFDGFLAVDKCVDGSEVPQIRRN